MEKEKCLSFTLTYLRINRAIVKAEGGKFNRLKELVSHSAVESGKADKTVSAITPGR